MAAALAGSSHHSATGASRGPSTGPAGPAASAGHEKASVTGTHTQPHPETHSATHPSTHSATNPQAQAQAQPGATQQSRRASQPAAAASAAAPSGGGVNVEAFRALHAHARTHTVIPTQLASALGPPRPAPPDTPAVASGRKVVLPPIVAPRAVVELPVVKEVIRHTPTVRQAHDHAQAQAAKGDDEVASDAMRAASAPTHGRLPEEVAESASMQSYRAATAKTYASRSSTLRRVNAHTSTQNGLLVKLRDEHVGPVLAADFGNETGTILASGGTDGRILVWDVPTQRVTASLAVGTHASALTCLLWDKSADEGAILVSGHADGAVRVWDARKPDHGTIRVLHHLADRVNSVALSDDSSMCAAAGATGSILIYNMERVAAMGGDPRTTGRDLIMVWIQQRGPSNPNGHAGPVLKLRWSPDNQLLASADADGCVHVWHITAGGRLVRALVRHEMPVTDVTWDPAGLRLAACSEDGTATMWSLESGAVLRTLDGHGGAALRAIAFTGDAGGRRLLTAGDDKSVCMWDSATGLLMQRMENIHSGPILSLCVRADSKVFATASSDGDIGLWMALAPSIQEHLAWGWQQFKVVSSEQIAATRQRYRDWSERRRRRAEEGEPACKCPDFEKLTAKVVPWATPDEEEENGGEANPPDSPPTAGADKSTGAAPPAATPPKVIRRAKDLRKHRNTEGADAERAAAEERAARRHKQQQRKHRGAGHAGDPTAHNEGADGASPPERPQEGSAARSAPLESAAAGASVTPAPQGQPTGAEASTGAGSMSHRDGAGALPGASTSRLGAGALPDLGTS